MTIEHNGLIIIGENFNTSRKIKGSSPRVVHEGDKYSLTYTNLDGDKASLDITDGFPTEPAEQKNYMIPHITHALKNDDIDYITWIVKNQELNGAHIIDLCVDEITHYPEERLEWMRKAVGVMQSITDKPLSLDSSDGDTVMAGLEVYDREKEPGRTFDNIPRPVHGVPMLPRAFQASSWHCSNDTNWDDLQQISSTSWSDLR